MLILNMLIILKRKDGRNIVYNQLYVKHKKG